MTWVLMFFKIIEYSNYVKNDVEIQIKLRLTLKKMKYVYV